MRNLKTLAEQAKNRLRGKDSKFSSLQLIQGGSIEFKRILDEKNEKLYEKVKEILKKEESFTNPISQIMDMKHYNSLNSTEKERYFFKMLDKYHEIRQHCLKESG